MLQFEANFVFVQCSYRKLHAMKPSKRRGRRTKIKWRNFSVDLLLHENGTVQQSARCMYISIVSLVDYMQEGD